MKRTTKRYVITTSALNNYKYRVMSEGGDWEQYLKNSVLLWMHLRAFSNDRNQILPLGRAVDIRLEGDAWTCYLEFDENDPFAMMVYNKYENGTLSMLSLGALPLEWTDEPGMMLPGQVGPTVTKWKVTDVSCVDIGGQDEACACQLYDTNDNKIELSGLTGEGMIQLFQSLQPKKDDNDSMKLIQLTGAALQGILLTLKLKDDATEADVQKHVADQVQLNVEQGQQIISLTSAKTNAETQLKTAKDALAENIKLANEAAIVDTVDKHKNKFLPAQRENFIRLATADLASTKSLLEGMPTLTTIKEKLELAAGQTTELDGLIKLSWDELFHSGRLERLKELDNDQFLAKRAEKFPVKAGKK